MSIAPSPAKSPPNPTRTPNPHYAARGPPSPFCPTPLHSSSRGPIKRAPLGFSSLLSSIFCNRSSFLSSNSLPLQSEYNTLMRSRAIRLFYRISAAGLTLCLLIAPLCAARCSLSTCLPTSAPSESSSACHHHTSKSHHSPSLASIPATSCQIADSLFTAAPTSQFRLIPPPANSHSLAASSANIPTFTANSHIAAPPLPSNLNSPPKNFSLSASPLRL
jgi:hypothetical protein